MLKALISMSFCVIKAVNCRVGYLDTYCKNMNFHCEHLTRSFFQFLETHTGFRPTWVLLLNGFWLAVWDSAYTTLIGWNLKNFPGYKLNIKIILRLTKRGDQVLISISIILKFSAQMPYLIKHIFCYAVKPLYHE